MVCGFEPLAKKLRILVLLIMFRLGYYNMSTRPVKCHSFGMIDVLSLERAEHSLRGRVMKPCRLDDAIGELGLFEISSSDIEMLVKLGAVYRGRTIKGQDVIKWSRIDINQESPSNLILKPDSLIRVHPRPKRYPVCGSTEWESRVVYQDEGLLIVNKPPGLPCMSHESNSYEVLDGCVARGLGMPGLEACHRLDTFTTGLVVLSKTKESNRSFKALLSSTSALLSSTSALLSSTSADDGSHSPPLKIRKVTKVYEAVTFKPVDLGIMTHFMFDGPFDQRQRVLNNGRSLLRPRGPRLLSHHELPGWKKCQLRVLECKRMQPDHTGNHPWLFFNLPTSTPLFMSRIQLMTGRTHQIRAQLAAHGCPLVGDKMYGDAVMHELLVDKGGVVEDPELAEAISCLPQLDGHIGLHAASLAFESISASAPPPWI